MLRFISNIKVSSFSIDIWNHFVYTVLASKYSVWVPADAVTAPQENRKPGVNPGRYRHCMRGGSLFGESRSLGKPEKATQSLWSASQKNCSNVVKTLGSASTEPVVFCCGKTAAAARYRVAAAFLLWPSACGFPLLHGLPWRSQPANQLNIAYWYGEVIRSESGTTVHCCVSSIA